MLNWKSPKLACEGKGLDITQMMDFVLKMVGNVAGKGENAGFHHCWSP